MQLTFAQCLANHPLVVVVKYLKVMFCGLRLHTKFKFGERGTSIVHSVSTVLRSDCVNSCSDTRLNNSLNHLTHKELFRGDIV